MIRILALLICATPIAAAERPNIIVLLCDDLGHGDLSCYGHEIIETPNLDGLAAGGIRVCGILMVCCSQSRTRDCETVHYGSRGVAVEIPLPPRTNP